MSKNIITRIVRIKTNIITIAIIVEQRQLEKYEHREHTKNRSNDRKKKNQSTPNSGRSQLHYTRHIFKLKRWL